MKLLHKHLIIQFFTCLIILQANSLCAQEIVGTWSGAINIGQQKLTIVFNLNKSESELKATMSVPAQGLTDFAAEKATLNDTVNELKLSFTQIGITYKGRLTELGEIKGTFYQSGFEIPLNLQRGSQPIVRPQTPVPPFPYKSVDLTIPTTDNLKISGTLTLPDNQLPHTLVILLSGSGPQNRDSEMFGHKPFLVIADALTRQGIAVFRYDERGVGKSEGSFQDASIEDVSTDIEAIIRYFESTKEFKIAKTGLIGHSLGGLLAAKVAARNKLVDLVVLMATPGLDGTQVLLQQKATLERLKGYTEEQIAQAQEFIKGAYAIIENTTTEGKKLQDSLTTFFNKNYGSILPESQQKALVTQLTQNEFVFLIRENPAQFLSKINCPVLAIKGDKDFQVAAHENLNAIKTSLAEHKNPDVSTIEFKGLNHLFQTSKTGGLEEYAAIEETMAPVVLDTLIKWLKERN